MEEKQIKILYEQDLKLRAQNSSLRFRLALPSIAICALIIGNGCGPGQNSNKNFPAVSEKTSTNDIPKGSSNNDENDRKSWKMHYTSKCQDQDAEKCVGAYGFSIHANGTYEIGPGPNGQTLTGRLEPHEKRLLSNYVEFNPAEETSSEICVASSDSTEPEKFEDQIDVTAKAKLFHLKKSKIQLCYQSLTEGKAKEISESLRKLVAKYYPRTFPNPCVNAAHELQGFYASVRSCEKDVDCSYVDEGFTPLSESDVHHVTFDNCTYIKPLLVANHYKSVTSQLELLIKRELAQSICGNELQRESCAKPDELVIHRRPPKCIQGFCQINPRSSHL